MTDAKLKPQPLHHEEMGFQLFKVEFWDSKNNEHKLFNLNNSLLVLKMGPILKSQ